MTARVALDAMAVQRSGRGVSRLLREIVPLLLKPTSGLDAFALTTAEGAELLGPVEGEVVIVPRTPKSAWEQTGLPWLATRHGADRLYTCSECGPLWGPSTLLHIPEDPYVRWAIAPVATHHERLRRWYQRATMARGVARATCLVVNSQPVADQLRQRFAPSMPVNVIPLGVDTALFYPDDGGIRDVSIFHLGSDEPRDQTELVLAAYAAALAMCPDLPDLIIAGNLTNLRRSLLEQTSLLGLRDRVQYRGRVSDQELRQLYSQCAICVQPARYEGFGLQPLEALACGAPLIVLADPAVREVVGTAAEVTDGPSVTAVAKTIKALWQDAQSRAHYRSAGPDRAHLFTWHNTSTQLATHLNELT